MNILEQRAKNKIKIQVLKKMLEESTKKKVELQEGYAQNGFENEKTVKAAIKKLVSKKMSAGQALLLAKKINDSIFLQDDLDIDDLFLSYGINLEKLGFEGSLTGGIEQLLQKIGYVLTKGDVDVLLKGNEHGAMEIGTILVKLFYSGEAQRFISDEFIRATAMKVVLSKQFANDCLNAFTGGDPLNEEYKDIEFKYFRPRGKVLITAFAKKGLAEPE